MVELSTIPFLFARITITNGIERASHAEWLIQGPGEQGSSGGSSARTGGTEAN